MVHASRTSREENEEKGPIKFDENFTMNTCVLCAHWQDREWGIFNFLILHFSYGKGQDLSPSVRSWQATRNSISCCYSEFGLISTQQERWCGILWTYEDLIRCAIIVKMACYSSPDVLAWRTSLVPHVSSDKFAFAQKCGVRDVEKE